VLIQAVGAAFSVAESFSKRRSCPQHLTRVIQLAAEQGADLLLTVKNGQRRLFQQIVSQFRGHPHFPVVISDFEVGHGRQVRWELRARNATDAISVRWVGASWIIELVSTGRRDGKAFYHVHYYGLRPTASTSPPCAPAQKHCYDWSGSGGQSKTSGTGPVTPNSVRMSTATANAMVFRSPRVQERCHPFHPYTRGLEEMTDASLQRGRQG